jgi:methyl-accepting chemotaxis protein
MSSNKMPTLVQEFVLMLLIPIVSLYLFLFSSVVTSYEQYTQIKKDMICMSDTSQFVDLSRTLSNERVLLTRFLTQSGTREQYVASYTKTNTLFSSLKNKLDDAKGLSWDKEFLDEFNNNIRQSELTLNKARALFQQDPIQRESIEELYFSASDSILDILESSCEGAIDAEINRFISSYTDLEVSLEILGRTRNIVGTILENRIITNKDLSFVATKSKDLESNLVGSVESILDKKSLKLLEKAVEEILSTEAIQLLNTLSKLNAGQLPENISTTPSTWYDLHSQSITQIETILRTLKGELQHFSDNELKTNQNRLIWYLFLCFGCIGLTCLLTYQGYKRIMKQMSTLTVSLEAIGKGDLRSSIPLEGNNEFGNLSRSINATLLANSRNIIKELVKVSSFLNESTSEVASVSKEIKSTSAQQSAGVKEVVTTMEDTDSLSKMIASKMQSVNATLSTAENKIVTGVEEVNKNEEIMNSIQESSSSMIEGIKILSTQISSIWEIVNIINSIADQTKIIAFNAELEASSAGEAGKNFQIVATEIRRLADNTVSSTDEIRKKISEIQRSSDQLIVKAEEGTSRVAEGTKASQKLLEIFGSIKEASKETVGNSSNVSTSIHQQTHAFEQILQTMKQISEGINSFVIATEGMSSLSEKLRSTSTSLENIVSEYQLPEEKK